MGKHCWTPRTIKQRVEIPSYRRAAVNFSELTEVVVSKSGLADLVKSYGAQIVSQQAVEAEATVKAPSKDEECF